MRRIRMEWRRYARCRGVVPPQHSICSRLRSNPVGFEYCAFLRPAFVGIVKAVELLPQHAASSKNEEAVGRLLLKKGADIGAKGEGGKTALKLAARLRDEGRVRGVCRKGAE